MKIALFDTNILIDYSRGIEPARKLITTTPHRLISLITWMEFLIGIPLPAQEETKLFLNENFDVIEISRKIAEEAVLIRKTHKIALPDALIYASAKTEGLTLLTRNTKDFNPDWDDVNVPYSL